MFPANRLSLFGAPSKNNVLAAVSTALVKARSNHDLTNEQLADGLGCCAVTIQNAIGEHRLMRADTLLRLAYFFPEEFTPVAALMTMAKPEALTITDHLDRLQGDIDAIRRDTSTGLRVAS